MIGIDWNLARSFLAVGETGSLSAAARALQSSQPTIGRHVDDLERALGVRLFLRGPRGYELTDQGAALLVQARAAGEHMDALSRLALGAGETMAGPVRVTASEVIAAFVLPRILARLGEAEPAIEVEIVATNQVENLLRRDADIAVRMARPAQSELVARRLPDIPLRACAATAYLNRKGRPQKIADLLDHDLIGFDRDDSIIKGFAAHGIAVERNRFRFRTDNQIVLWEAVRAGNGISFAQAPLIDADPAVEALLPELQLPSLPMWLAMHRDVRTSPRIRRVADFLADGLLRYAGAQR